MSDVEYELTDDKWYCPFCKCARDLDIATCCSRPRPHSELFERVSGEPTYKVINRRIAQEKRKEAARNRALMDQVEKIHEVIDKAHEEDPSVKRVEISGSVSREVQQYLTDQGFDVWYVGPAYLSISRGTTVVAW